MYVTLVDILDFTKESAVHQPWVYLLRFRNVASQCPRHHHLKPGHVPHPPELVQGKRLLLRLRHFVLILIVLILPAFLFIFPTLVVVIALPVDELLYISRFQFIRPLPVLIIVFICGCDESRELQQRCPLLYYTTAQLQ